MKRSHVWIPIVLTLLLSTAMRSSGVAQDASARHFGSLFSGRGLGRNKPPSEQQGMEALARLRAWQAELAQEQPQSGQQRRRRGPAVPAAAEAKMSVEERAAAARTVVRAYLASESDAELVRTVDALRPQHTPTFTSPLRPEREVLATVLLAIDTWRAGREAPAVLRAHPAASAFPGAVGTEAERGSHSVTVDRSVPGWHSTGLYAAPGEVVRVSFAADAGPPAEVRVQIGSHTDSITRRAVWQRPPRIVRSYSLRGPGPHDVANVFGGLIYLIADAGGQGPLSLRVEGAVRAPYFVLDRTSVEDWKQGLRTAPAPFGELASDKIVLTLPSSVLRTLDDPEAVMRFWSRVVEAQDELAAYERPRPERFVFDRQISVGYMHAGYPLMGPVSAAAGALDLAQLREKGSWGMFHEIGHNHQLARYGRYANPWTFDGNIEVTCNIFASYTYVAVLDKPENMGHQHWRADRLAANLAKDFTRQPYAKKSHRERCLFWVHLIHEFGWEALRKVFAACAELPREQWPDADLAKRGLLLELYGRVTGKDLSAFFAGWGLEVPEPVRQRLAELPAFEPSIALPR